MTYDNIKSHREAGFRPLFRRCIFGKTMGWIKLTPTAFSGLIYVAFSNSNDKYFHGFQMQF